MGLRRRNKAILIKYIPKVQWFWNENAKEMIMKNEKQNVAKHITVNTATPITSNVMEQEMDKSQQDSIDDVCVEIVPNALNVCEEIQNVLDIDDDEVISKSP